MIDLTAAQQTERESERVANAPAAETSAAEMAAIRERAERVSGRYLSGRELGEKVALAARLAFPSLPAGERESMAAIATEKLLRRHGEPRLPRQRESMARSIAWSRGTNPGSRAVAYMDALAAVAGAKGERVALAVPAERVTLRYLTGDGNGNGALHALYRGSREWRDSAASWKRESRAKSRKRAELVADELVADSDWLAAAEAREAIAAGDYSIRPAPISGDTLPLAQECAHQVAADADAAGVPLSLGAVGNVTAALAAGIPDVDGDFPHGKQLAERLGCEPAALRQRVTRGGRILRGMYPDGADLAAIVRAAAERLALTARSEATDAPQFDDKWEAVAAAEKLVDALASKEGRTIAAPLAAPRPLASVPARMRSRTTVAVRSGAPLRQLAGASRMSRKRHHAEPPAPLATRGERLALADSNGTVVGGIERLESVPGRVGLPDPCYVVRAPESESVTPR